MNAPICQCLPCYLNPKLCLETDAEDNSPTRVLPFEILEKPLLYLNTNDLLIASSVCKRWRLIAAIIYQKTQDAILYSKPCFQQFYNGLINSQHFFVFDVSSSMDANKTKETAKKLYAKISTFIAPAITQSGVYICKFASECMLKHFKTDKKAAEFIDKASKLRDGSDLSVAMEAVIDKLRFTNETTQTTHVHIISDMSVRFDEGILLRPELHELGSKITFHYYDATENPENDFLKRIATAYQTQKDILIQNLRDDVQPKSNKRYGDTVEIEFYRSKKPKK